MITLIGVGHVFDIYDAVKKNVKMRKPSVVCLELDRHRYEALMQRAKRRDKEFGYNLLAYFQERIARKYGTHVGSEMIAAIETAKELNVDIAFIDLDASVIFSKIWVSMTLKEKIKLFVGSFFGLFANKGSVDRELKKFEENSKKYIENFEKEFPVLKKILIDERDKHMANAIQELSKKYDNIVAVVGDGHVDGIAKLLQNLDVEIIRLRDLLKYSNET